MTVKDGPACSGCGLPNYEGICPHCSGDQDTYERELVPPFESSIPDSPEQVTVARFDTNPFPTYPDLACPTCGHRRGDHNPYFRRSEPSCSHDCDCPGFPFPDSDVSLSATFRSPVSLDELNRRVQAFLANELHVSEGSRWSLEYTDAPYARSPEDSSQEVKP